MQYFRMEHLAQYFTRLIVLSAEHYEQNLKGMENELGRMCFVAFTYDHRRSALKSLRTSCTVY